MVITSHAHIHFTTVFIAIFFLTVSVAFFTWSFYHKHSFIWSQPHGLFIPVFIPTFFLDGSIFFLDGHFIICTWSFYHPFHPRLSHYIITQLILQSPPDTLFLFDCFYVSLIMMSTMTYVLSYFSRRVRCDEEKMDRLEDVVQRWPWNPQWWDTLL